jgi:KipI family sensor histidine kinase inhibitor
MLPRVNDPGQRLLPEFEPLGEACLLLRFGHALDPAIAARVQALAGALGRVQAPCPLELVAGPASLALHFDPLRADAGQLEHWLRPRLPELLQATPATTARRIEIPVCYGGDYGPDLADVASHAGLTEDATIALHAGGEYIVAMIGFLPGFPYLLGLDPRLAMPRLATPRARVREGAVGIGGAQTGIYPQASPGGWRLVGRTPERLFDAMRTPPSLLAPGDRVRFVPITPSEFKRLERDPLTPEPAA